MKIEINIEKRHLVFLVALICVLFIVGVNASTYKNPVNKVGHDANETGPGTFGGNTTSVYTFPGALNIDSGKATFTWAAGAGEILSLAGNNGQKVHLQNLNVKFRIIDSLWQTELFTVAQDPNNRDGRAVFWWQPNEGEVLSLTGNNSQKIHLQNLNGRFRLINSPWNWEIFSVSQTGNVITSGNIATNGYDPNTNSKGWVWRMGVHTYDVFAEASVWADDWLGTGGDLSVKGKISGQLDCRTVWGPGNVYGDTANCEGSEWVLTGGGSCDGGTTHWIHEIGRAS